MMTVQIDNKPFYIPDKGSPCGIWKSYFQKLKKEVGRDNAKLIWLLTWDENGSVTCTANPEFNDWLKKNDIDVSNQATRTIADISQIGQNVLGLGKGITKILSTGLPIALGGILLFILIILMNTAKNVRIEDLVALAVPGQKLLKG